MDVEGFGDQRRTNAHQVAVRDGLYQALRRAFGNANIAWSDCEHEDRGDGVFVLAPAEVPKSSFVGAVPDALLEALHEHNRGHCVEERIRLRMALHAGEITYDEHGATAAAINLAFRLLDARPLKAALADSPGVLAIIASSWFYDEVIRHFTTNNSAMYRPIRITVKETRTVAWICLPDHPSSPRQPALPPADSGISVPRQLPTCTPHFVGRTEELLQLTALLDTVAEGGTVVISAINGTAGVGKTALAVHWAHQVADRFPDGQLYVNLRGFDPTGSAMTSAEALRGFLDAFEVPPERIPTNLDAQAALYRTIMASRQVLVVLDNARDVDQIRPLLPAAADSRVVVTSRNQLTSLITAEGAHPLILDLLTNADARQLLARRLGPGRVAIEPQAVEEIIASCARLPLALSIVAARAATHPRFGLATLARDLRNARGGLEAFDGGDAAANARAVFSWSYQHLEAPVARMFRLLGLHPGPDITAPAAASLAGVPEGQVRPMLAALARAHLLAEHTPGRFVLHDLLRAYAMELTCTLDPEDQRHNATQRTLDHYLHTAYAAALLLYPRTGLITLGPRHSGVTPEQLADYRAAWTWFDDEYPVLLAIIQVAATEQTACAWQLTWALVDFLERRGHWHDWVAIQHAALAAARYRSDRRGQAYSHLGLGRAEPWLGHHNDANKHLRNALGLFTELGDQTGQAHTHIELGHMFAHQDHHLEALAQAQQALVLFRAAGDHFGQARALNQSGWYQALLGDHHLALTHCEQALTLFRGVGDRRGESRALDSLGYARHHLGHHQQAIGYYQQSLILKQELGDRYGEATTLTHLADTQHSTGNPAAAHDSWKRALHILDQLGFVSGMNLEYPDADQIRAKLRRAQSAAPIASQDPDEHSAN